SRKPTRATSSSRLARSRRPARTATTGAVSAALDREINSALVTGVTIRRSAACSSLEQGIQAARAPGPARQDGRGKADALAGCLGVSVAQLDPLHDDRTDPDLHQAFGTVAVADHALPPVRQGLVFIVARNASASASIACASNPRAPLRRTAVSGSSITLD